MSPERWRQIDEMFRAVSQAEPRRRGALLAELSAGDEGLRREVEALLEASEEAGGFLETNVFEAAAPLLAGESRKLGAGQVLGRYRVVEQIGAGGMGEVYLAEDTRLKRKVALKWLPDFLTADPERVRRFGHEAQAVASLSHPHIVTIHEVFEAEAGPHCIVMEHVEGRTLRELLAGAPLKAREALDIAVQMASALSAAHEAGVVHRDVKPENVMLRPDGYVKVLDFGLAKLAERPGGGPAAPFGSLTRSGVVMGTAHYMSPEQARGLKVDARTDVWSLGVVLYEMLAGRPPFEGETMSDVLASLLREEPAPLPMQGTDAPAELQRIISKALAKQREDRYSSMGEMLTELREAREEERFRARLSGGSGGAPLNISGAALRDRGGQGRRRTLLWAAALTVAVSALALGLYQYVRSARAPSPPPTPKMARITADGKIKAVAVTHDGKYIAYAAGPQQGLWVMQAGTDSSVQIVPPTEGAVYWGLTFSPEGDYVYFVRNVKSGPWELYRVPTLGGTPKRLLVSIDTAVAFSPDGRQMAFGRYTQEGETSQLLVANTDGTGERVVATRKGPDFFNLQGVVKIAWSPDGESIACPAWNAESPGDHIFEVVAVSLKDGTERPLTRRKWMTLQQVAWLGDGSGLVMVARDEPSSTRQVWYLSYPEGDARRLTNDFNSYDDITVTADSGSLLTIQTDLLSNVWVAPEADAARARQITDGRNEGLYGLSWMPDGRVVFSSRVGDNVDIWMMDADGGNRRRLTDYANWDANPSVSPDGRYIVFESRRAGAVNLWRMDADGGNPVQLTRGLIEYIPRCSPDGRWVYYSAFSPGDNHPTVWKVPIEGGDPVQVTVANQTLRPTASPDRKWLAYQYSDLQANPPHGWAVAPAEGGPPVRRFDISTETEVLDWTPDSRALAYIDPRSLNVWAQPLDGGRPRQLTDFKSDQTFYFAFSRDSRQLALARGTRTSDLVRITDFK